MADGPAYYYGQMNLALNDDWVVGFVYSYVDSGGNVLGPVDLTGSQFELQIRTDEGDHSAIVTIATPTDITLDNPKQGYFTIRLLHGLMVYLAPGNYVSDLVRFLPNGYQERVFAVDVTVVQGVTR